jgi:hypothetical protein
MECEYVEWIELTEVKVQWRALVNAVMISQVL